MTGHRTQSDMAMNMNTMKVTTISGLPITPARLKQFLVFNGGRASLIVDQSIPDDYHVVVISLEIQPWGDAFGSYNLIWRGPEVTVEFTLSSLFDGATESTSISFGIVPQEVEFTNNSTFSQWHDGQEFVRRGYAKVIPEKNTTEVSTSEGYEWCFRMALVATGNAQARIVIQALPWSKKKVQSSPWGDSEYVAGIFLETVEVDWYPQFPANSGHPGPAPFLVDRRPVEVRDSGVFPTSQQYRDAVLGILMRARLPAELSPLEANRATPTMQVTPLKGDFTRVVDVVLPSSTVTVDSHQNAKRPRFSTEAATASATPLLGKYNTEFKEKGDKKLGPNKKRRVFNSYNQISSNDSGVVQYLKKVIGPRTHDMLEFVGNMLKKEELPRPAPKPFVPKNSEIQILRSYKVPPPKGYFDTWPRTPIPSTGVFTHLNVDRFEQYCRQSTGLSRVRLQLVLKDLREGTDSLVRGIGRIPTVTPNSSSAIEAGARTSDALVSMMKLGVVAGPFAQPPFAQSKINGITATPKPDGSIRPCGNLSAPAGSSFNDGIDTNMLLPSPMDSAKTFITALESAGRNSRMLKMDQKNAYKYMPQCRRDWPLQVYEWQGAWFVELCQIFGASSAVGNYDRLHECIIVDLVLPQCSIPRHLVLRTLDDVPVVTPESSPWLMEFHAKYVEVCSNLNIDLAENSADADKAFLNTTIGTVFGVTFDTERWLWWFPKDKRLRMYHDIMDLIKVNESSLEQLESVNGKIQDFAILLPMGRFFKHRLLRWVNSSEDKSVMVPIDSLLKKDLAWWTLMVRLNAQGFPIPRYTRSPPSDFLRYTSDAAGTSYLQEMDKGVASFRFASEELPQFLSILQWPDNIQRGCLAPDGKSLSNKLTLLELVGVTLPFMMDNHALAGRHVLCETDNFGTYSVWWNGHSRQDELSTTLVRALFHLVAASGSTLYVAWVRRNSTTASQWVDSFSKGRLDPFRHIQVPEPLPSPPKAFMSWLRDPKVDDSLGPRILEEMASNQNPPPLLGYTV